MQVAQRAGQVLAEGPAGRRAVVVDDADLIVAKAVDAVLVEEEAGVADQEVAHLRFGEVEDQSAGMAVVAEVERAAVVAGRGLAVEVVQALVAELATGMVVKVKVDRIVL